MKNQIISIWFLETERYAGVKDFLESNQPMQVTGQRMNGIKTKPAMSNRNYLLSQTFCHSSPGLQIEWVTLKLATKFSLS